MRVLQFQLTPIQKITLLCFLKLKTCSCLNKTTNLYDSHDFDSMGKGASDLKN